MVIVVQCEGVFVFYVEVVFYYMWCELKKMDDFEVVVKVLVFFGFDVVKLLVCSQEFDVKVGLIENIEKVVVCGVFGLLIFFVGNEMFFGKEQLCEVEEMVLGIGVQ